MKSVLKVSTYFSKSSSHFACVSIRRVVMVVSRCSMGKNRMESASRRSLQLVQRWWLPFGCSLMWEYQRMLACPERRWSPEQVFVPR
ncbi:MAG: hypothetical protein BJ554DRAFT_543 [Olpidium bornovanus]|uniref:Uncharacterized protein n=1 Tax=Olpidium bornovanus TaxID=278681 RepID=A0A8H8A1Q6_9FUNG|nr:MAG: hypothetical protein BJ554DRAFT_543 [Olpidium bornovanus]